MSVVTCTILDNLGGFINSILNMLLSDLHASEFRLNKLLIPHNIVDLNDVMNFMQVGSVVNVSF